MLPTAHVAVQHEGAGPGGGDEGGEGHLGGRHQPHPGHAHQPHTPEGVRDVSHKSKTGFLLLISHKNFSPRYLKEQFRKADTNRSGFLSFKEVKELCHRLNVKMKKDDLERMFDQANTNKEDKTPIWKERGGQVLNEEEFVTFYYNLMRREEIDELFDKYSEKVIAV